MEIRKKGPSPVFLFRFSFTVIEKPVLLLIKAVHECNGTLQIFITNKSDENQRQA
jgi:hypothetical protein